MVILDSYNVGSSDAKVLPLEYFVLTLWAIGTKVASLLEALEVVFLETSLPGWDDEDPVSEDSYTLAQRLEGSFIKKCDAPVDWGFGLSNVLSVSVLS